MYQLLQHRKPAHISEVWLHYMEMTLQTYLDMVRHWAT